MIVLGQLSLVASLILSLAAVAFLTLGVAQRSSALIRNGYYAVYGLFLSAVVASTVLLTAFLGKDFNFAYVAENSATDLSTFYRIAGFWAGQAGSFLLWMFLLTIVVAVIALRDLERLDRLTATAVAVLAAIAAFFAALMVFDSGLTDGMANSNPFVRSPAGGVDGMGLNPLLLHPAMVLHPPALFIGYAWLAAPFAFAIAALILGRSDREWVTRSRGWAISGWAFLSLGIGLGAWWAYYELAFGGYWAWDPVENTSFVPWLTATALLHSMQLYRKRGIFKHWTLALATSTFWLTIVATWVTRSGLIQSVHAFGKRLPLVVLLTGFVLLILGLSVALIAARWREFESKDPLESFASRDFMYYLTNVLFAVFAFAVAFATIVPPLLLDKTIGKDAYSAFAEPLGILVLAAIGICPLLAWGRTEGRTFWRNVRWPGAAALVALVLLTVFGSWHSDLLGLIGLAVCVFSAGAIVQYIVVGARGAARTRGWAAGLWRSLGASRPRTASYVAHFGMVLLMAGMIGSNMYKVETSPYIDAKPGAETTIGDYTLRFVEVTTGTGEQQSQEQAVVFDVFRGDEKVGQAAPRFDTFPNGQTAARAAVLHLPTRDLYVAPSEFGEKKISLQVYVFPLQQLVWVGSVLLVLGAVVSLWPKRERAARGSTEVASEPAATGGDAS